MIAKHVPIRKPRAARFSRLVQYLLDPQEKLERVGKLSVTNCYSLDPERAVLEVLNTQAQNVRAKSDKSYHLVVSFAAGENPSEETLAAIEQSLVESLGYQDHQRLSVVHQDTDCLHIHVAINKIHPRRLTIHEPIRDYYTLGAQCAQLEITHGLRVTNHQGQRERLQQGAAHMETRSQRESLTSWVRRECGAAFTGAATWEEWHTLAADFGLTTRRRGNGLVIESADGLAIKASAVDRAFSLAALEKRLGAFAEPRDRHIKARRTYVPNPMQPDPGALYARFQRERDNYAEALTRNRKRLKTAKREALDRARRHQSERRRRLRLLPPSHGKRLLYGEIARVYRRRLELIFVQAKEAQRLVTQTYGRLTWADWLSREAVRGDLQALLALRARARALELKNGIRGDHSLGQSPATEPPTAAAGLTKNGSVFLRPGIRDSGRRVTIESNRNIHDYVALLKLAEQRYGARLHAEGDERFRAQIVLAAAVSRRNIVFEDVALENRRKHLVNVMEKLNERADPAGRRAADRSGTQGTRESRRDQRRGVFKTAVDSPTVVARVVARTDSEFPRTSAPPQSIDGLRKLSGIPLVGERQGAPVLLPDDAHDDVGQRRSAPADSLRRPLVTRNLKNQLPDAWALADRYIAERMEKRLILSDIPKHERHVQPGQYPFAGLRTLDGQSLALFTTDRGVSVMPVSDYAAKRLRAVPLNKSVRVSANGPRLGKSR